jgi:hypothetical protein
MGVGATPPNRSDQQGAEPYPTGRIPLAIKQHGPVAAPEGGVAFPVVPETRTQDPRMAQQKDPAPPQEAHAERWWRREAVYLATGYLVIAVASLVAARWKWEGLDFLGVGWIIVLALLPLIPWLVPRSGHLLKVVAPRVRSFSLAGVQIELKDTQNTPLTLPSAGKLAGLPNDLSAFSTSTHITDLISALRACRQQGGGPAAVIDLRNGEKWMLRNLYFLAYLLEGNDHVEELVFTETRAGTDGFLVGTATPVGFRQKIAQASPAYANATLKAPLPQPRDLSDPKVAQETAKTFMTFTETLNEAAATGTALEREAVQAYVSSASLVQLAGAALSRVSVEEIGGTLTEDDIRTVLSHRDPYVPSTVGGQLTGLLDRNVVALSVARAAVAHS